MVRRPSKTDTRARVVDTTEKGNELLLSVIGDMKEAQAKILKGVDQEKVRKELKKLLSELKKENI